MRTAEGIFGSCRAGKAQKPQRKMLQDANPNCHCWPTRRSMPQVILHTHTSQLNVCECLYKIKCSNYTCYTIVRRKYDSACGQGETPKKPIQGPNLHRVCMDLTMSDRVCVLECEYGPYYYNFLNNILFTLKMPYNLLKIRL